MVRLWIAVVVDRRPVLDDIARVLTATCRRDKRARPGTFELLNDCERLNFRLT